VIKVTAGATTVRNKQPQAQVGRPASRRSPGPPLPPVLNRPVAVSQHSPPTEFRGEHLPTAFPAKCVARGGGELPPRRCWSHRPGLGPRQRGSHRRGPLAPARYRGRADDPGWALALSGQHAGRQRRTTRRGHQVVHAVRRWLGG